MKLLIFFLVVSHFSASSRSSHNCNHGKTYFKCVKFIDNYDGDTITVQIPNVHPLIGLNIPIRLKGIDAPEIHGENKCEKEKAEEVRAIVNGLLSTGKKIHIVNISRGKYFRIIADVLIDNLNLSSYLLAHKLVVPYGGDKKERTNWCKYGRK